MSDTHAGLALRESEDGSAARHARAGRDRRAGRREVRRDARGAGRVRAESQQRCGARRTRRGASRARSSPVPSAASGKGAADAVVDDRRAPAPRHHRRAAGRAEARRSASRAARSPPATRRASTTAPRAAARVGRARLRELGLPADGALRRQRGRRRRAAATWASGPIPATRRRWSGPGSAAGDIDLVELNEAFAAQSIAVHERAGARPGERQRQRRRDRARATRSAARARAWLTTLMHELRRRGVRYGLASMCIGVGQGISTIVERAMSISATRRAAGRRGRRARGRPVLAIAAHEIKNALGPLTMTLAAVRAPRGEGSRCRARGSARSRAPGAAIAQLVNDLLDTARIDPGGWRCACARSICARWSGAVETFRRGHARRIVCDLPALAAGDPPTASAWRRCWSNFLDNAAKYCARARAPIAGAHEPGGPTRAHRGHRSRPRHRARGSRADLRTLFRAAPHGRGRGGLGLGLYSAARSPRATAARWASTAPGPGATFWLDLRLGQT